MFNILSNSCQMIVFDIYCKKLQSEERNLRESSISADCHFPEWRSRKMKNGCAGGFHLWMRTRLWRAQCRQCDPIRQNFATLAQF